MTRTQTLNDPTTHLKDLIAKKGVSEHHCTSLSGVNIVVNPHDHIHSDSEKDTMDLLLKCVERDPEYGRLIAHISHVDNEHLYYLLEDYYGLEGLMCYIKVNRAEEQFAVSFVVPEVDANVFSDDVEILSHMVVFWAKIARLPVKQFQIYIPYAHMRWEAMEEDNLLYTEYESN
jgi:hypothetical protein